MAKTGKKGRPDTHNKNNSKKLLLIQINGQKLAAIRQLCMSLEIQPIVIEPKDFGKPLGHLAQITGMPGGIVPERTPCPGDIMPSVEIMIFCGLDPDALDIFLAAYRNAGIAPVGLKAVITPANIRWDIYTLCRELMREHLQWNK